MAQARFVTEGFTCPSCVKKIEKTVGGMDGVNDVQVMFNSGKVKVNWDDVVLSEDDISTTIGKLGYPIRKIQK